MHPRKAAALFLSICWVMALAVATMGQAKVIRGWNIVASPGLTLLTGASITFPFGTVLTDSASGKAVFTGTTPMIQLGGTTSSFPMLRTNGSQLYVRLADDSGYTDVVAAKFTANGLISTTSGYGLGGSQTLSISATAPSAPSSCGTGSPAVTNANGTLAFNVTLGTGTPSACSVTMPTATSGWNCHVTDLTTQNANVFLQKQSGGSTTSVTVTNYNTAGAATAMVNGDVLEFVCAGR